MCREDKEDSVQMSERERFDLVVIGAGPGGYEAAFEASRLGMTVALIEKEALGGTCLNHGCIPTKSLLHAADLYDEMKRADRFGIHANAVTYDLKAMKERKDDVVLALRDGIAATAKQKKVTVLTGVGVIEGPHTVRVGDEEIEARFILIATGSRAVVPPIPGADLPNVVTSDGMLERTEPCQSLVIIGGGVIGMEFASLYSKLGTEVTVIEALPRILANLDKEISQSLKMQMKKRGVRVLTSARVEEIRRTEEGLTVLYEEKGIRSEQGADRVLIAVGRRPYTEGLFGEHTERPAAERGRILTDEYGRTSVPSLYACGDVTGGVMLAHAAAAEGRNAAAHMRWVLDRERAAGGNREEGAADADSLPESALRTEEELKRSLIDTSVVPSCVYTSPEIASVGLTADQAKEQGIRTVTKKYVMTANGRTVLSGGERGFIRLVCAGEDGRLLGAQLFCGRAADIAGELADAVVNGLTAGDLGRVIRPHPTFCEAVTEAARS